MSTNRQWLEANKKEVSEFGARVADLAAELFGGLHRIHNAAIKANWASPQQVAIVIRDDHVSTYDSDLLTRLVILAHKHNIRASIHGAANRYIRLVFIPVNKSGFFRDNHPSIDELIAYCQDLSKTASTNAKTNKRRI